MARLNAAFNIKCYRFALISDRDAIPSRSLSTGLSTKEIEKRNKGGDKGRLNGTRCTAPHSGSIVYL